MCRPRFYICRYQVKEFFGKGLEGNLPKRKEQKEQLSDLVPDFAQARSDSGRKRKFVDNRNTWNNKRSQPDLSNKTAFQSKPKTAYSAYSRFNDDKKSSYGYKKAPKDTGHSFRIPLKQRKWLKDKFDTTMSSDTSWGSSQIFLEKWKKITDDQWVLSLIEEGYKLEFIQKPPLWSQTLKM